MTHKEAIEWQKRIKEIKADILRYKSDCGVTAFGSPKCERCNENMFGSILRIIDKYKEESEEGAEE